MRYTSRDRDRGRLVVNAVTVLGTAGALTATGWLMGSAARDFAAQQASAGTDTEGDQRTKSGLRERPSVTRVTVRYVTSTGSTVPGPGPSVVPDDGSSGSDGGSGSSGSSSGPGPAPEQAPAPSSGS
jgi:hypothetical protein